MTEIAPIAAAPSAVPSRYCPAHLFAARKSATLVVYFWVVIAIYVMKARKAPTISQSIQTIFNP
jgi:hypothetical protein